MRSPLSALVIANAVSLLGNVVSVVALPWLVLVTTGSAAKTGITAFVTTVPFAVGGILGGALSDRIGARLTSVLGDGLSALAIAVLPVLHLFGVLAFWHVLVIGFVKSAFDAPGTAARRAILPQLAEESGVSLERANSLYTSTEHIGYVTGAPLAGLTIAWLGAANVLWIDAVSFALAALLVAVAVPTVRITASGAGYVQDVADGLRFMARESVIGRWIIRASFGNFLASWLAPVLVPVYAREIFDSSVRLGVMVGALGVGGILGTVLYGATTGWIGRRGIYVTTLLAYPVLVLTLVPLPPLGPVLVTLLLFGLCLGAVIPMQQTITHEYTPAEMRGRVFGTFVAATTTAGALGMLCCGLIIDAFGLRTTLLILAAGFVLFVVRGLVDLRATPDAYSRADPGSLGRRFDEARARTSR